ncbi:hypothetical protein MN608_06550 [Microdochium nivale]|nr:hypothetical protein MN608_06550 [Microdochium nivale]
MESYQASSERSGAVHRHDGEHSTTEVAHALEIARESPESAKDAVVANILETALHTIWTKVVAQPEEYVMTRDEFAVFNFFENRFGSSKLALSARRRYWDSIMDGVLDQPTYAGRSYLPYVVGILRLALQKLAVLATEPHGMNSRIVAHADSLAIRELVHRTLRILFSKDGDGDKGNNDSDIVGDNDDNVENDDDDSCYK